MLYSDCIEKLLQLKDVPICGYKTILHIRKRRHICPICGKRFDEKISFLSRYHRFTNRVFLNIYEQFKDRERVKFVVMDMTGGYKYLMKRLFPDATIIVDKYHYVRQIGYALERTRVEEQKKLSDKWKKYFKKSKYLLLKDSSKLKMDDYVQLQNLFRISPALKQAYEFKQSFEHFTESTDRKHNDFYSKKESSCSSWNYHHPNIIYRASKTTHSSNHKTSQNP